MFMSTALQSNPKHEFSLLLTKLNQKMYLFTLSLPLVLILCLLSKVFLLSNEASCCLLEDLWVSSFSVMHHIRHSLRSASLKILNI